MDMYPKYISPLGYQMGDNRIDSYGVNHSGFNTQDSLYYNLARNKRENALIDQYKAQGITKNYPQYGTNFWGVSANNNYGFGNSDIVGTVEPMLSNPLANPPLNQNQTVQYAQNNLPQIANDVNTSRSIDYSKYGAGFSKKFIDQMLNDRDYQRALQEYAIPNEKGYVNNVNDPGGETNMGISKRYHPNEDIKNLTRERANALLYNEVWNWNGINKLPREIKGFVFDHGIRTSPQNVIETTHRALGINPVGDIIGNTTLNLLQHTNYEDFLHKYQNLVKEQDRNNANYNYFGNGWNNRTNGYHVSY